MERKMVLRFFTLKRINPQDIHTKLLSMYEPNAFALLTMYKWHQRFADERTEFCNDPRPGRPLHCDLADTLDTMLQECYFTSCKKLCVRFRIGRLRACAF
jgi:hypothetical protein